MSDPLDAVQDDELRRQLLLLRANYFTVLDSDRLGEILKGFRSQKGIYKPSGSSHALWVRQTLRGTYPDQEPEYHADGSWIFRYSPEGRQGRPDMSLDTNRAMLQCRDDRIPVGVMRQVLSKGGRTSYEVMGLAYVEDYDGTHFLLHGERIEWETIPALGTATPEPFHPFEEELVRLTPELRIQRDQRFGTVVRKAYHERCSLCEVGYRVRGRVLGVEAAHIIPVGDRGNAADIRNGLLLCRNHHVLFDELAWTPDEDLRVLVADDDDFRRSAQANCVLDWEGKRLPNLPGRADLCPAAEALRFRLERFEGVR